MKCPICKFSKCRWIELAPDARKVRDLKKLETVVNHNIDVINMMFRGSDSAYAEERAYQRLQPYCDEIERRKKGTTNAKR